MCYFSCCCPVKSETTALSLDKLEMDNTAEPPIQDGAEKPEEPMLSGAAAAAGTEPTTAFVSPTLIWMSPSPDKKSSSKTPPAPKTPVTPLGQLFRSASKGVAAAVAALSPDGWLVGTSAAQHTPGGTYAQKKVARKAKKSRKGK